MADEKKMLRDAVIKYLCTFRKELDKFWVSLESFCGDKEFYTSLSWLEGDLVDDESCFGNEDGLYLTFGEAYIFLPNTTVAFIEMKDTFDSLYGENSLIAPDMTDLCFDGDETVTYKFFANIAGLDDNNCYKISKEIACDIVEALKQFNSTPIFFEEDDYGEFKENWQEADNYYVGITGSYSRYDDKYEIE